MIKPRMQAKPSRSSTGVTLPSGSPGDPRVIGTRTPKTPKGFLNTRV